MKTLTESDNNQVVELTVAAAFALHLAENRTAGYRWATPEFDHEILSLQSDDVIGPAAGAPPGAGGARHFVFRVAAAGTTKLELAYRRSWEGDAASASRYSLTIVSKV